MSKHTLYLCYFGLREPLVQTQVLPYLREIAKMENLKVHLLTFEPNLKKSWTAEKLETEKRNLADNNINWHYLAYHESPSAPATLYFADLAKMFIFIRIMRNCQKGKLNNYK